jgi:broad specificity phosphatase PhoE
MSGIVSGRVVDVDARAPGGESLRDLSWRLGEFAGWLGQLPELGDGTGDTRAAGDVVIVAHGGSIRALAAHLGGSALDRRLWDPVPNCSIRRFPLALVAPGAPLALLGSGPGNQGGS